MYKKKTQDWLKHWDFMLVDVICLQAAYLIACFIKQRNGNLFNTSIYRNTIIVSTLLSILITILLDTYKNVLKRGYYIEFIATVKQVGIVGLLTVLYLFVMQESQQFSRVVMVVMIALYGIFSYTTRIFYKYLIKKSAGKRQKRSLLVITMRDKASTCIKQIKKNSYQGYSLNGICIIDCDESGKNIEGIPVVASKATIADYVCKEWVDEVFIDASLLEEDQEILLQQFWDMGVVTHVQLEPVNRPLNQKQFVERLGGYTVMTTSINYATSGQLFVKRIFDIAGGIVGTILTGILLLIIAPVIKIQSPGPVFFLQERVGKNGKKFKIYKFRTMYMDAEERKKDLMDKNRVNDPRMFKLDFDPRIIGNKIMEDGTQKTGFMDLCRRLSIDEFPQFLNVLKGEMSLVGTRPPTVDEFDIYEFHHKARLAVKPGITGMWQVSGRSNITNFEEVVKLDKKYIAEWNIGLDIKILLKTIQVVLKREGSM